VTLLDQVAAYSQTHNLIASGDKIVVGVSGGADSLCLLALLREMAPTHDLQLHVAHLNHSLRGQTSDDDAAFVAELAKRWNLPFTTQKEDVAAWARKKKASLEEAARQARYAFLSEVARDANAGKIAVGHNANDQAETVLMHFLRGAGVAGLRGMLPIAPLDHYAASITPLEKRRGMWAKPLRLIRPLLGASRSKIERYCQEHNLSPRFDQSNLDSTFFRNRLRHELLPVLENYNPNIYQALRKTADLMAADYEILQNKLERSWRFVLKSEDEQAITFDRQDWQILPLAMQRLTLRKAIQTLRQNLRNIDFSHIEQAIALLDAGHTGDGIDLPQNLRLILDYNTITLADKPYQLPLPNLPYLHSDAPITVNAPGITTLPGSAWYIHANLIIRSALSDYALTQRAPWRVYLDAAVVGDVPILRTRQAGDSFHPFGLKGHRQKLKKFMNNQKIPAGQRDLTPLLISEAGEICWVCGWRIDHRCRVTAKTERVLSVEFKFRG